MMTTILSKPVHRTDPTAARPAVRLERLPGQSGPVLYWSGPLCITTADLLRREMPLVEALGHPFVTLSLADCELMDVEGVLTLLDSFKRLQEAGHCLVVVAGPGQPARLLKRTGVDAIIPLFATEEAAARAQRGGGLARPAPETWEEARRSTLALWRAIRDALVHAYAEDILRRLTSMSGLCERAEAVSQEHHAASPRCQFCPLFEALGGRPEDVGCRSLLDPIIAAVRTDSREAARTQVEAVIRLIEQMPVPEEEGFPISWLLSMPPTDG